MLGVGNSSHSRAALTPHTCHRQLFGVAQSLHSRVLPGIRPFPEPFLQKGYALYFAEYEGVLMQA